MGNMGLARYQTGSYLLSLTDGYIGRSKAVASTPGTINPSCEDRMADHLHRLASRAVRSDSPLMEDPLHIWIVGTNGWVSKPTLGLIDAICDGEKEPSYRIVIASLNHAAVRKPFLSDWNSWLRCAGMPRIKRHRDKNAFQTAGAALLRKMSDHYMKTGEPPTRVLEDLGVSVSCSRSAGQY
ncbi:MAG: hypothetical protein IID41_03720 [Planctomycetes bacterium]|nr:hypothetical protein [Planctomycetota bacterium]